MCTVQYWLSLTFWLIKEQHWIVLIRMYILTLPWTAKLMCFGFFWVFLELTDTFLWDILSLSLHCNGEIREKENFDIKRYNILIAEELRTGGLFLLHPHQHSQSMDCLRLPPWWCSHCLHNRGKARAICGRKSRLHGDLDCRGTTVIMFLF